MNTPTFNIGTERTPVRPLPSLSTYVTMELGDDLRSVVQGSLSHEAFEEKCRDVSSAAIEPLRSLQEPQEIAIAHLDVMMLPQGLKAAGRELPSKVRDLITMFATLKNAVPMLTYEDIVLRNPSSDPRLFSRGDIGNSELFFYDIHRRIEKEMTDIRSTLFPMLLKQTQRTLMCAGVVGMEKPPYPKQILPYEIEECCQDLLPHLSSVRGAMQSLFDELEPAHFMHFRPYFSPSNDPAFGQLPGPSGNFSGGMYCFDGLCIGRQPLMQELNAAKDVDFQFFPRVSTKPKLYETQEEMSDVRGYLDVHGLTLEDCSVEYARGPGIQVMRTMKEIRLVHLELFKKFIGSGPGTAFKFPAYLTLAPRAFEQAISDLH